MVNIKKYSAYFPSIFLQNNFIAIQLKHKFTKQSGNEQFVPLFVIKIGMLQQWIVWWCSTQLSGHR
jgi:hypothetical protein